MRVAWVVGAIVAATSLMALAGFRGSEDPDPLHPDPQALLKDKCLRCHNGPSGAGGLDLSGDLTALAGLKQVVRSHPHDSVLFKRVADGTMPKGGPKLTNNEQALIRDWIMSLRPDPTALFKAKCVGCHGGNSPAAQMDLSGSLKDLAMLKESHSASGLVADAALYKRVANGSMPPAGPLNAQEMALVRDFVSSVKPDPTAILKAKCAGCHGSDKPAGNLNLSASLDDIAKTDAVVKGDPASSGLYKLIANGSMPQGGKPLSDSEQGVFWDWIGSMKKPSN